jgi:hypothetical protein
MIGRDGSASPVRAMFPLATLGGVQFVRQFGTAPAFAAPAALPITALTGVGQLAYAKFRSPDYLNAQRIIPAAGTLLARDGDDEVRTPYDNCVLIMPTQRPKPGETAVRLGRLKT